MLTDISMARFTYFPLLIRAFIKLSIRKARAGRHHKCQMNQEKFLLALIKFF